MVRQIRERVQQYRPESTERLVRQVQTELEFASPERIEQLWLTILDQRISFFDRLLGERPSDPTTDELWRWLAALSDNTGSYWTRGGAYSAMPSMNLELAEDFVLDRVERFREAQEMIPRLFRALNSAVRDANEAYEQERN